MHRKSVLHKTKYTAPLNALAIVEKESEKAEKMETRVFRRGKKKLEIPNFVDKKAWYRGILIFRHLNRRFRKKTSHLTKHLSSEVVGWTV